MLDLKDLIPHKKIGREERDWLGSRGRSATFLKVLPTFLFAIFLNGVKMWKCRELKKERKKENLKPQFDLNGMPR